MQLPCPKAFHRCIPGKNTTKINDMEITFNPTKREKTLSERGLDFLRAPEVFAEEQYTRQDKRKDYGEPRFITIGTLDGRMVVLVWTPRDNARHIISLRKANDREQTRYQAYVD